MWITLAAMTISASMILVDQTAVPLATPDAVEDLGAQIDEGQWILTANILPLAAFMVLGGRLGDLYGLRKVFLAGAAIFGVSTAFAGFAQDVPWMIAARASQGAGAALMMPTGVAIVSSVFPANHRGTALGSSPVLRLLRGARPGARRAADSIDWRLVFLINVPLAAAAILTLRATPPLAPGGDDKPAIDWAGSSPSASASRRWSSGSARARPSAGASPRRSGRWCARSSASWPSSSSSSGSRTR